MKNKKSILIIDGNNNLYRAHYRFQSMRTLEGTPTGTLYGFLTMTRGLIHKFKPDLVYIIFDGNKSKHRLSILPNYKNREKREDWDGESFSRQQNDIIRTLKYLGINCIKMGGYEADDLIYCVARKFRKENVTIVSRDKDFNQLINDNISIWDGQGQILLTPKNLKHRAGYDPHECVDWLSLDGDASDKIPGVLGFGKKTIRKFLDAFGSVKEFLDSPDTFGAAGTKITAEQMELNRRLIDLKYFYRKYLKHEDLSFLDIKVKNKKIKHKKAQVLLLQYETKLMYKKEFTQIFEDYVQNQNT